MKKSTAKNYVILLIVLLSFIIVACNCNKKCNISVEKSSIIKDSVRYIKPIFEELTVEKDILFAEVMNSKDSLEKLHLDIYMPAGDSLTDRAAILWVHGGGFRAGDKMQGYIFKLANEFAKRGYVCISTDYRLRENPKDDMEGTIADAVSDVMKALIWVKCNSEKYGINRNYIAIGGGSAGGILSTNLCYRDANETETLDKSGVFAFINLWGSPNSDRMDKVIDKNDPPTILIHGMADTIVPYANCEWLSGELEKAGVRYTVYPIEGAGHTPVEHMDEIVKQIENFLYAILSGK